MIDWIMFAIGVGGVIVITLAVYWIVEWFTFLLCLRDWWRGYWLVVAGFLSATVIMGLIFLGTGGVK